MIHLTNEQIESRLTMLEGMIAKADVKDLPSLNATFQRLIDEQVRRDMVRDDAATPSTEVHYQRRGQRRREEP